MNPPFIIKEVSFFSGDNILLNIHCRPGELLEIYLDQVCKYLNSVGFHAHKNHPKRSFSGKYIEGEPFDYEFFINGKVYCFDAKENFSDPHQWKVKLTGQRGIKTNARILKQATNLLNCKRQGAEAFFLVAFGHKNNTSPFKLVMYDAELVYNALLNDKRFLQFTEGCEFDINKLIN